MELLDRVRRTIRRYRLAGRDTSMVVAVSGGSDSVALACLITELAARGELRVAGLAHFNHQLRPGADADEQFCRDLAHRLSLPFAAGRGDVRGSAVRERQSIEAAARLARYAFLEQARHELSADLVAVGHTRDDQAETFLLRLIRGAGARGLAGIHPRRGAVVRPLIDCRRDELREYLASAGVPFVTDETNADVSIPRNRVRAELLPLLGSRFNPAIVDVLAGEADVAREEWAWMRGEAEALARRIARRTADGWRFDAAALAAAPPALARLVVREAIDECASAGSVSLVHLDRIMDVVRNGAAAADVPGGRAERFGSELILSGAAPCGRPEPNLFRYSLSIPGEVRVAEAGCIVSAEPAGSPERVRAVLRTLQSASARLDTAVVRVDPARSLAVRNRRAGDRFRPLGLAGTKKLQDFFVDRKVARPGRDRVPLVVDDADRIVWVAGHAIGEDFRVTDPAQAVVILRLKGLGGSA